jgi:zinc transporter 9
VFFIGCGVNVYHGVHALWSETVVEPFSLLVIGLLVFSLVLEGWTFSVALKEMGGWRSIRENRRNTTVLAVLLEDAVAMLGIVLTLVVAGVSYVRGPYPIFDAIIAIAVGVLLGVMAVFLAALNRLLLIDTSDMSIDRDAETWLATKNVRAKVSSLILEDDRLVVFVRSAQQRHDSAVLGDSLRDYLDAAHGKHVDAVYWQFTKTAPSAP